MSDEHRLLSLEDLVAIATRIGRGEPGIRDLGLLQSAAARPATSVFGEDAYPDLATKAAAIIRTAAMTTMRPIFFGAVAAYFPFMHDPVPGYE